MKGYRTVRSVYHSLIPEGSRDRVYLWSRAPIKSMKPRVVAAFEKDAPHHDIYDDAYYGSSSNEDAALGDTMANRSPRSSPHCLQLGSDGVLPTIAP